MSVSILVVDDEPDVADLFRQRFRRETRQGTYVMHFANSGPVVAEPKAFIDFPQSYRSKGNKRTLVLHHH